MAMSKGCQRKESKINYGMDPTRKKKKRMPKEDLDTSASSHDSKKCGARSVQKQRGMAFSFWKTATAVITPDR
jgi:hypothetical protein